MKITSLFTLAAGLLLAFGSHTKAQVTLDPNAASGYIGDFSGSIVSSDTIAGGDGTLTVAEIDAAGGVYSGGGGTAKWTISSGELVNFQSGGPDRGAGVIVEGPLATGQQLSFDYDFNGGTGREFEFTIVGVASSGTATMDKDFDQSITFGNGFTDLGSFSFTRTIAGSDTGSFVYDNGGSGFDTTGYSSLVVQIDNTANPTTGRADFAMDNLSITPIPEPSVALLLCASLGLGLLLQRRRRA